MATIAHNKKMESFELFVLPTEQCNFRCTYCYEDFEIGAMSEDTIEGIKQLTLRRLPKLGFFTMSWFGGEPLMAKKRVLELSGFAQRECAAAGVTYHSHMTTNAFGLDRETFAALVNVGVTAYQISIDGDEDEHNKTRKLMSGNGTFKRIWANLLAMRDNPASFSILLRLHVHSENVDSLKELLPKIQAEFGADPRFRVLIKAVGNWGGESVKQMKLSKNSGEVVAELNQLLTQLGWYDVRPSTNSLATHGTCYAAKPNSFVVRADGRLAKCTVAFNDPRNSIGRINRDGTVEIENEKMRAFMRGFQTMNEDELGCPMKNMPRMDEIKVIKFEKMPRQEERLAVAA